MSVNSRQREPDVRKQHIGGPQTSTGGAGSPRPRLTGREVCSTMSGMLAPRAWRRPDDALELPSRIWLAACAVIALSIGCSSPPPPVEAEDTVVVECDSLSPPGPCHTYEPDASGSECILAARPPGFTCDDEDECTTGDQCNLLQACLGSPVLCEPDGNPCTAETCLESEGCVSVDAPSGTPCEDGNPCTVNDACGSGGACATGEDVCGDCDPEVAGECDKYIPSANRCLGDVVCAEGKCLFDAATAKPPCDTSANNGCRTTGCDPSTGECATVVAAPDTPCDDGNPCHSLGACDGSGTCSSGAPLDCADADEACTTDYCVVGGPVEGCLSVTTCECAADADCAQPPVGCVVAACVDQACVFEVAPDGTRECDGVWCTDGDSCDAGVCVPGPSACDDANPCTTDLCVGGASECVHIANVGACDDGDPCTVGDACREGAVCEGQVLLCDDHEPCTVDACDPATSECAFTPKMGPCDDGDVCTTQDFCNAGTCKGGAPDPCDDDNPCTDDVCDPEARGCVNAANAATCDDGDACTAGDSCAGSTCQPGPLLVCDDDVACTIDGCDPATGCTTTPDDAPCDDLDPCTLDTCTGAGCANEPLGGCCHNAGECGPPGDPCLQAQCADNACVAAPIPGCCESPTDCNDDGDPCTATTCNANTCGHAPIASCCGDIEGCPDDGDPCTATTCDDAVCGHVAVEGCCETVEDCPASTDVCGVVVCEASECKSDQLANCCHTATDCGDDDDPCTETACTDDVCAHVPIPSCCEDAVDCDDDGDPCTTASCDTLTCQNQPIEGCCEDTSDCDDDGDLCTATTCTEATCSHQPIPGCCETPTDCPDDAEPCTDATCLDNACTYPPIPSCCESPPDCTDDDDPCTTATCEDSTCSYAPIAGCCETPTDCEDDGDPCTTTACDEQSCAHHAIAGCCETTDDCPDDEDPCTQLACDQLECAQLTIPGCCELPEDCADDEHPCTTTACTDLTCQYDPIPGCCESPTDCEDDGDPCTATTCGEMVCAHQPTPNCCESPVDCADDEDPCTETLCNELQCAHDNIPGCCESLEDCEDDNEPCTTTGCTDLVCHHDATPGCCQTVDDCADDGDPCTAPLCEDEVCSDVDLPDCCELDDDCAPTAPCMEASCDTETNVCIETPVECGDDDPCTTDVCDPATGDCMFSPLDCDDGNPCTDDVCVDGLCGPEILQLSLGHDNACVLCSDSRVRCWGAEAHLFYGYAGGSDIASPIDRELVGLQPTAIAVGEGFGCVIDGAGQVHCWGKNHVGQLGRGTTGDASASPEPVLVASELQTPLTGAVAIDSGDEHTCAVLDDGGVWCWGSNAQLQVSAEAPPDSQPLAVEVLGVADALTVSAGNHSTCATTEEGKVFCWGTETGAAPVLGGGASTYADSFVEVLAVGGTGPFLGANTVAVGTKHACAVRSDGTAACWGNNSNGAIGTASPTLAPAPLDVVGLSPPAPLEDATGVIAATCHSCALSTASCDALCWGCNSQGQLSSGVVGHQWHASIFALPDGTEEGMAAVSIAASEATTCVVLADNSIACAGSNVDALLGPNADGAGPALIPASLLCSPPQ